MKILVTGGSGFIGWNLVEAMKRENELLYTYFNNRHLSEGANAYKLDVENKEETIKLIKKTSPDIIIHTIAVPSVDLCETDRDLAQRINVEGTENITDACIATNSKIIFISTTHVFRGHEIYTEDDDPDPVNNYASTKVEGERIVSSSGISYMILRTDQPYGWKEAWHKENSVTRLLKMLRKGEKMREVSDWYNTPTFIEDFTEAVKKLINRKAEGIYHVVGQDFVSRYEWSLKAAEIFGFDTSLVDPTESDYFGLPAKRANTHASNKKIEKETGLKMKGIEEGLRIMKEQYY